MIKRMVSISFLVALLIPCCGCFNKNFIKPTQQQIDEFVKNNPDLPELDKACIYDGRFEVGMRKETVRFLLGEPKTIEQIQQPWAMQEKWTYKYGGDKIFYMEDNGVVGIEEL